MGRPYSDDLRRRIVAARSGSSSFGHLGCRKRWRAVVQYQSLFSARCCAARKLPGLFRRVRLGKGKNIGRAGEAALGSRERVFTILVVEDHGFIPSEFEGAVRRNGGRVLGPAARVSEASR